MAKTLYQSDNGQFYDTPELAYEADATHLLKLLKETAYSMLLHDDAGFKSIFTTPRVDARMMADSIVNNLDAWKKLLETVSVWMKITEPDAQR
jgi:hypothetical protein